MTATSPTTERRRRRWPWILAVVTALLVACCAGAALWVRTNGMPFLEPEDTEASPYVRNDSPETVKIRLVDPGGELTDTVPSGKMHGYGQGTDCKVTRIEARFFSGVVIGSVDADGCTTQTWIIASDGTTRLEPGMVEHS